MMLIEIQILFNLHLKRAQIYEERNLILRLISLLHFAWVNQGMLVLMDSLSNNLKSEMTI